MRTAWERSSRVLNWPPFSKYPFLLFRPFSLQCPFSAPASLFTIMASALVTKKVVPSYEAVFESRYQVFMQHAPSFPHPFFYAPVMHLDAASLEIRAVDLGLVHKPLRLSFR